MQLTRQLNEVRTQLQDKDIPLRDRMALSKRRNELLDELNIAVPKKAKSPKPVTVKTLDDPKVKEVPRRPEGEEPETHKGVKGVIDKVMIGDHVVNTRGEAWSQRNSAERAITELGLTGLARVVGSGSAWSGGSGFWLEITEQLPRGTVLEVRSHETYDKDMDANIYHDVLMPPKGITEEDFHKIVQSHQPRAKLKNGGVTLNREAMISAARSMGVKLDVSNLDYNNQKAFVSDDDAGVVLSKLKERDSEQASPSPVSELIERYRGGEFVNMKGSEFRAIMVDVHNEGMELDEIKTGLKEWVKANPDLIAA
jgi:hypothetical protein